MTGCIGFGSALVPLRGLDVVDAEGSVDVAGKRVRTPPNLWLLDYGDWMAVASAPLAGVARAACNTAQELLTASAPPQD